ncbi:hypothetical protein [Thermomonas brevis]
MRATTRGNWSKKSMSSVVLAPGATGCGRSMRTTLRSVLGPLSGCTNVQVAGWPPCATLSRRM